MDWAIKALITNKKFGKIIIASRCITRDIQYIPETIALLKKSTHQVLVMGPVVEYQYLLPKLLAKFGDSPDIMKYSAYEEKKQLSNTLAKFITSTSGDYLPTINYMCNSEKAECQLTTRNGIPMQFDYGHLTHEGAVTIMSKFIAEK
jgi:hypothetical protein